MSALTDKLLADPSASIVTVAVIQWRLVFDSTEWIADGGGAWYLTWPAQPVAPTLVYEKGASAFTAMTPVASLALCQVTENSWFYDRVDKRLYVNPTGAIARTIMAQFPLRIGTTGKTFDIGGTIVTIFEALLQAPNVTRSVNILQPTPTLSVGSIDIATTNLPFNLLSCYMRGFVGNQTVELYVGGKTSNNEELGWSDYFKYFTGQIANGGTFDLINLRLSLNVTDTGPLQTAIVPIGVYAGRPDQIITSAFNVAGLAAPIIAGDVATLAPYSCSITIEAPTPVRQVLELCLRHRLVYSVDENGAVRIDAWKNPPTSGEVLSVDLSWEPSRDQAVSVSVDHQFGVKTTNVKMQTGRRGTNTLKRRSDDQDEEVQENRNVGPWTQMNVNGNLRCWYTTFNNEVLNVRYYVAPGTDYTLDEASSVSGCDNDNLSWFQGVDDVSGVNRLYINPPASVNPNNDEVVVRYKVEKKRQTASRVSGGQNSRDVNNQTATNLFNALLFNQSGDSLQNSLIMTKAYALQFAQDMLALQSRPIERWVLNLPYAKLATLRLMQTIKIKDDLGVTRYLSVIRSSINWEARQIEISGFRYHASGQ